MAYEYFSYQRTLAHRRRQEGLLRLAERLPPGSRGVDLGAGDALLTHSLSARLHVLAVDLLPVAFGRSVQGDANRLPFAAGSLDFVVAGELLEHMETPLATVVEIERVLRPGGWFLGSVPNSGQFWDLLAMLRGWAPYQVYRKLVTPAYEHQSFFTAKALRALLTLAGLDCIEITTNLLRLWPGSDREIPILSSMLCRGLPRFGDRLMWIARKEVLCPQ